MKCSPKGIWRPTEWLYSHMWLLMDVAPPTDVILRVTTQAPNTQSSKPSHKSVYKKSRQFFDFLFCGNMLQLYYMFLMPRGETSHSKTSVTNTNKTATSLRRRLCRAGTSDSPQGALDRPLRNLRWR